MNLHELKNRVFEETGLKLSEDDPLLLASKLMFMMLEEKNRDLIAHSQETLHKSNKALEDNIAWLKDQRNKLVADLAYQAHNKAQTSTLETLLPLQKEFLTSLKDDYLHGQEEFINILRKEFKEIEQEKKWRTHTIIGLFILQTIFFLIFLYLSR
jgi:molecular chaperone GrpE (heat shock protein)